jgi:predicted GNAT family acetyltransferase
MGIVHPALPTDFLDRAGDFLARHEAEHGLMLGVARATPRPPPDAYFAVVYDDGKPVAAAMRLDWRLILSRSDVPDAMTLLAADAASPLLRNVLGPTESVGRFTDATAHEWRDVMTQGIYECRAVTPPSHADGVRRLAMPNDRERLAEWLRGFTAEALHDTISESDALARVDAHIDDRHFHVWDVGGTLVSLAAAVAPTLHGIRVNHVYTPPDCRGRGYASALVGSLTQNLLGAGYRFAFLHTDLANPISNRLYMRLGYRQVATFQMAQLTAL